MAHSPPALQLAHAHASRLCWPCSRGRLALFFFRFCNQGPLITVHGCRPGVTPPLLPYRFRGACPCDRGLNSHFPINTGSGAVGYGGPRGAPTPPVYSGCTLIPVGFGAGGSPESNRSGLRRTPGWGAGCARRRGTSPRGSKTPRVVRVQRVRFLLRLHAFGCRSWKKIRPRAWCHC